MARFRRTDRRRCERLLMSLLFLAGVIAPGKLFAQQEAVNHLNPVIEKLAAGKPFIGFQTGDFSLENARNLSRTQIDYVYLEMEHGPMDFEGMHRFTVGMIDKAAILKKGNAQPNVAIFARFAPYGREQAQWFVKQALDIGLMGVIFNGIDNPEQALLAVRNMRYPQKRTSKYPNPARTPRIRAGDGGLLVGRVGRGIRAASGSVALESGWRFVGHHDDRNNRGLEERRRDCVGARCGCDLRWCRRRPASIPGSGKQLTGSGASLPNHLKSLPGSQCGMWDYGSDAR
jgi:hypothetical protein